LTLVELGKTSKVVRSKVSKSVKVLEIVHKQGQWILAFIFVKKKELIHGPFKRNLSGKLLFILVKAK